MSFYQRLFEVGGIFNLLIVCLIFLLPLVCIIHCVMAKRSLRSKIIWIVLLVLTLIFGAIAYMCTQARQHKWLARLAIGFLLLLIFNLAFHSTVNWYIVKDAKHQAAVATQTLKSLNVSDLSQVEQNHAVTYVRLTVGIANEFHGSYADAPPVAKEALLESVNFLRLFNIATKDGKLTREQYLHIVPAGQANIAY